MADVVLLRPCREFAQPLAGGWSLVGRRKRCLLGAVSAPAGDLLWLRRNFVFLGGQESRQRNRPCCMALRVRCVPTRLQARCPSKSVRQAIGLVFGPFSVHQVYRAAPNSLRYAAFRQGARSQFLKSLARRPANPPLLAHAEREPRNTVTPRCASAGGSGCRPAPPVFVHQFREGRGERDTSGLRKCKLPRRFFMGAFTDESEDLATASFECCSGR